MEIEKLGISGSRNCELEAIKWTENYKTVSLIYVEHSTDHYHPDSETEIDITEKDAQEIVDFLCQHFNITPKGK